MPITTNTTLLEGPGLKVLQAGDWVELHEDRRGVRHTVELSLEQFDELARSLGYEAKTFAPVRRAAA